MSRPVFFKLVVGSLEIVMIHATIPCYMDFESSVMSQLESTLLSSSTKAYQVVERKSY